MPTPLAAGERPVPFRVAEGFGQLSLGNVGLALESFRKALRDDGSSIDAMMGIAACYDRMARFDLSRRHYEAALAIAPGDTRLLAAFAASLDLQGQATEAASVRREIDQRVAAAAATVVRPAAPAAASAANPAKPVALPGKPSSRAQTVVAAKAPPAPAPRPVTSVAAAPPAPAPRVAASVATAPPAPAPRLVTRAVPVPPAPEPRAVARAAATPPAPAVAQVPIAPPVPAARQAPAARPALATTQLALASATPPVAREAAKPAEAIPAPAAAGPAPIRPAQPAIGRSVTVELPPARPVAEAAPARPVVEVPAPAARAAVAEPATSAKAGARLERMSLTEMALITTPGPQWRTLTVESTARSSTVRFVPLRRSAARPVEIRLLNAARVDRLAARTRSYLVGRGWRPMPIGNAQAVRNRSIIFYPANRRTTALTLSRQFGFAIAQQSNSRHIIVLLGRDAARVAALRARG